MAEHNEKGKLGEVLAKELLIEKGYTLLALNWRYGRMEVDMIAQIGNTLVFVEVKTRRTEFFGLPESFVTEKKQQLLAKAAEGFCRNYSDDKLDVRYDIIAVILSRNEKKILHFEDAFFPDNLGLNL